MNVAVFDNLLVNKNYKCRHLQTGAGTSNSNVLHVEIMVLRVGTNDPYSLSLFSYELSFESVIAVFLFIICDELHIFQNILQCAFHITFPFDLPSTIPSLALALTVIILCWQYEHVICVVSMRRWHVTWFLPLVVLLIAHVVHLDS